MTFPFERLVRNGHPLTVSRDAAIQPKIVQLDEEGFDRHVRLHITRLVNELADVHDLHDDSFGGPPPEVGDARQILVDIYALWEMLATAEGHKPEDLRRQAGEDEVTLVKGGFTNRLAVVGYHRTGPHEDPEKPWSRFDVTRVHGQYLRHHARQDCELGPCSLHSPSDHRMREWPLNWRADRELMERLCPAHGTGHPDPDHLAYLRARGEDPAEVDAIGVHGCCGCCRTDDEGE